MFRITSKTLKAVNMVFSSLIHKLFGVIDDRMLTKPLQQLITSKGIGKVNQAQISGQSISELLLIKALQDGNLEEQHSQTLLLTAEHAFNVATSRLYPPKEPQKHLRLFKKLIE